MMRNLILLPLLLLAFAASAQQIIKKPGQMTIEGEYVNTNLFMQNPLNATGSGFCITKMTVNGEEVIDGILSSSFEIKFSSLGLSSGDKVTIVIDHLEGGTPIVLNPQALGIEPSEEDRDAQEEER